MVHDECGGRRLAMGRRGQGQDRRLALRTRRRGGAFPRRPQCRSHVGDRRQDLQALPAAIGRRARRQAVDHRQRRRVRSACVRGRGRQAEDARRRGRARPAEDCRECGADPVAASRAGRLPRGCRDELGHQDRHDPARHRAGLRGQGRAPRHPGDGPCRSRHAADEDRSDADAPQCAAPRARPRRGLV